MARLKKKQKKKKHNLVSSICIGKILYQGFLRYDLFLRNVFCDWMRKTFRTLLFLCELSHQQRNNISGLAAKYKISTDYFLAMCWGMGVGGGGVVNPCRKEGSNYPVTIIYLVSLCLNIGRREITELLDTNKKRKLFVIKKKDKAMLRNWYNQIPHPALKVKLSFES